MRNDKKIRKKNVIAFDIGTRMTKIAIGKCTNGKLSVKKVMTLETPDSCVSNGRITNIGNLASAYKKFIKDEKIKEKYVIVNIKSSAIINRELVVPYNEDRKALDQIVKYEMKQLTTIQMDDYITQYQIIEDFFDEKIKMYRVLVTSIEKQMVETYLELIHAIGLKPYVMDVHFNTISKFFEVYEANQANGKTVAIIDIGYDGTDVTILTSGKYRMNRTIEYGYNALENMFINHLKLDYTEKQVQGLFSYGSEENKKIVKEALDYMINELNDIIRYHITRDSKNRVDKIFITGGLATMEPLVKYIEEQLGIASFEFDIPAKVLVGYKGEYDVPNYINVLGSLVRK